MRVELLGPLRVLDEHGIEVAVPAGRRRALLALDAAVVPAAALTAAFSARDN
ncbi:MULTISPECIES: hypothetical protein [Glycomyces]|uniref:Uncharacterized protein n=2 Tax=Glycomyces TaxID=58113 RepID=A0A9X3SUA3_9ACTN|nr:hypothetical protein [Glycomyces lechevalierae]MDA1385320.1 hypothetical protein [Glycomyces lechevalierae]MDR7337063.1 hypothetical protein [Glycomyces lechevalierae]